MSRNAKEGSKKYFHLREKGINLVFLKERHIDTEAYDKTIEKVVNIDGGLGMDAASDLERDSRSVGEVPGGKAFEQS